MYGGFVNACRCLRTARHGGYGLASDRVLQIAYSGIKVPLLLLATFAIALPSFFVLNLLLGVGSDFPEVLRALVATQAALTLILCSLCPFTAFWYTCVENYDAAILFNALMFAIASFAAQFLLRRYYRPLITRNIRHRLLMRGWLIVYAFVGIQMGWVLRPFVGNPSLPTHFFREGAWGNAYGGSNEDHQRRGGMGQRAASVGARRTIRAISLYLVNRQAQSRRPRECNGPC